MKKILFPLLAASWGLLLLGNGASSQQTAGELFEKALFVEEGQGDLQKAIGLYQDIVKRFPENRETAAKAHLHIGLCYEKLGLKEAERAFQKVINDFPEQRETVKLAREKLSLLPGARAALEKGGGEIRVQKVWGDAVDSFFTGTPSPDGRYLTYVDWQNFANLGVRDLVKGENRLLTDIKSWESGEMCYYSVFSPDGGEVAYSWQTKEMLNQLRTVKTDGSSTRIVHDGKDVTYQIPFGWTADGKNILTVFFAKDNSARIVSVALADGSVQELKTWAVNPSRMARMSLSPDGKYFACSYRPREDSGQSDIALLSTLGGPETALIEHPADDVVLGWSPDGRHVLFMSDRTGGIGIWSIRVSDGKAQGRPELVRGDMGNLRPLGMTREGKLYYGIYTGWSDIFTAPVDPATGKVLAPPVKAVRKYETFNSAPDLSPDGQWLVCISSRGKSAGETPSLLIRSMRTNEVREVNPKRGGGLNFHYLRWSPDGRSVLGVGQDENGKYGALLSIDVQTGETKIVVRSDKDDPAFAPNWAPDGKALFFLRSGKEFRRVMKFDLETGREKEIYRARKDTGTFWLMLSPDGRELAVAAENKIKIISSDGTESRELMETKGITTIAWTADGKHILFGKLQDGSQDVAELWSVPAAGGEPQKLGLTMSRLMHLRVSPDGKTIAFTASEQPGRSEVWVMENFLPSAQEAPEKGAGEGAGDYRMTRISVDPEKAGLAFISPDGEKLAIVGNDGDIWVRDIDSSKETRLTQTPNFEYWCFWSPDSRKIAYLDSLNGLHLVSVSGGAPITLIQPDSDFIKSGKFAWPSGWTPDGKMIVCMVRGMDLCGIPVDGGPWKDVFSYSGPGQKKDILQLALSPDNRLIACTSSWTGNGDIYILPVAGGEPIRVTDHPAFESSATWSPDGRKLAFQSDRSGEDEIWVVGISPEGKPEGEPAQISRGGAGIFSWTKDGRIGISKTSSIMNVVTTDLDSGQTTQLTKMLTHDQRPRWSPDGTRIAYISMKAGTMELWVVSAEGGEPRLVTGTSSGRHGVKYLTSPCWLPEGNDLASLVITGDPRNIGIWVIPVQGGVARKIGFTYEGEVHAIDWSPDGKKIAFDYWGAKDDRLIKGPGTYNGDINVIPAEGGEPFRVTRSEKEGLSFRTPRWSPDQRKIAFWGEKLLGWETGKPSAQVWIADLASGTAAPIMEKMSIPGKDLSWAPDGKSLFFSDSRNGIFRVPAEGGAPVKLSIEGSYPDCSPDGKKIAYSKLMKSSCEFWLIENFLPKEKK